jgi:hypothetical protein
MWSFVGDCSALVTVIHLFILVHVVQSFTLSSNMYAYPPPNYSQVSRDAVGGAGPVYAILIIGMLLFMASNAMPALYPSPEKIG